MGDDTDRVTVGLILNLLWDSCAYGLKVLYRKLRSVALSFYGPLPRRGSR